MIGFDRLYCVTVVRDTSVVSGCVLGVDGGGSCRSQGYLLGRFCRQRYVLAKHTCGCIRIVDVFVKNETRSNLIRSVGKLPGGGQSAVAVVCPVSLSPSVLSGGGDGPPTTDATVEQGICPCPCLCFNLFLFLCPFRKKCKLMRSLVHLLQDRDHRSMYHREEQSSKIQLPR